MVLIGYSMIALIVAALLFYAVVAFLPDGLVLDSERDVRPFELPEHRRMIAEDLENVRIPVGLRGYRFAETDELLDRLSAEIAIRDDEIAQLRHIELPSQDQAQPAANAASDSAVASDSAGPADSANQVRGMDVVDSANQTIQAESVGPADSVDLAGPVEPGDSAASAGRADPASSSERI
jgi:hypothetical protein